MWFNLSWPWEKSKNYDSKSMWIWYFNDKDDVNLLKYCQSRKVNDIYLHYSTENNKDKLNVLIEASHQLGIKFHLLYGAQVGPDFDTKKACEAIRGSYKGINWDGIHIDMEINKATFKGFNLALEQVFAASKSLNINLSADVETWRRDKQYYDLLNSYCNEFALMSYGQTKRAIATRVSLCRYRLRKPFKIGFESADAEGLEKTSFWELGEARMNGIIEEVKNSYKHDSLFNGIALHHWASLRRLKQ